MTARKAIARTSGQPLFTFDFAAPGASGVVFIDKQKIKTFKNELRLLVYADVGPGNHQFFIQLDKPATNSSMSSHDDFKYCQR